MNSLMTNRISRGFAMGLLAAPLLVNTLSAQDAEPAGEATPFRAEVWLLRVDLNAENRFGVRVPDEELEELAREGDIYDVTDRLEEAGEVTLLYKGAADGMVGNEVRVFGGTEKPFVSQSSPQNGNRRTISQSTVTDGVTFSMTPQRDGSGGLVGEYGLDYDIARPAEVMVQGDEVTLISRERTSMDGYFEIEERGPTILTGREARGNEDQPTETIFIARMVMEPGG